MSHPLVKMDGMRRGANAWRLLRSRPHLTLLYDHLDDGCGGGQIEEAPTGRVIYLDHRLDRRARHAVLMHELVHDEHDLLWPPGTPPGIVAIGERFVTRETVRRLVPFPDLEALVERLCGLDDACTAADVIGEFEVPVDVAHLALHLMAMGQRW